MEFIGKYLIKFGKEALFEIKLFARARISETAGDINFLRKICLPNKMLTN
jgi:hypothetical protein